jgi:hypothetical protein
MQPSWSHALDDVAKRQLIECGIALGHHAPEINDPFIWVASDDGGAIRPRMQDIRVRPVVGVEGCDKPSARNLAIDVERPILLSAYEG